MFSTTKCICALAILAIADPASAKLRGSVPTEPTNERRALKGASAAGIIALQGHHKQDCVDDCEAWNGGTKSQCQQCCSQTKQRTGQWTCNETFRNPPPPPPKKSSRSSKSSKGPGPVPSAAGNIALQGHHKQDCVDDCESWNGGTKSQCQQCCSQTKQRTGQWTCNKTFSNPPPGPGPQPPMPQPPMQPQCGASCSSNYECASLGDNQPPGSEWCGECNLVHGTRGFGTCYNASDDDNDDFVQPWTYPGGVGYTCAAQCNNNSDCQEGGFVDCGTCNKEHGTQGYNTCINPPENESTVALA